MASVIVENMEKPKSCTECPMCLYKQYERISYCMKEDKALSDNEEFTESPKWCPVKPND